jgi:dTDP-4-dehydrorhamnose 3,5-epimerase-like enzyme
LKPTFIPGGLAVDDRGEVAFVNNFTFSDVTRFYVVTNHTEGTVRAWHGHRRESRYVFAVTGAALVCCVRIDDWVNPAPTLDVARFVLSAHQPGLLYIPPGYANGFMTLTANATLLFYATGSLRDAQEDERRFPSRYWDPWRVEER